MSRLSGRWAPVWPVLAAAALATLVAGTLLVVRLPGASRPVPRARVPAIDVHAHLGGVETWPGRQSNFAEIVKSMDAANVQVIVDFRAPYPGHEVYGERVSQRLAQYPSRDRFKLFANVPIANTENILLADSMSEYKTWVAAVLRDAVERGASGLKLKFQAPNYWVYDRAGALVPLDTPELDELWAEAVRLRVPVLVHFAEPYKAFHQPGAQSASVRWEMLMYERERLLRRHPRLIFIGAHWGSAAQDVSYLAEMLRRYPNFYVDGGAHAPGDAFASIDAEKREFLERFQDQIMFATDYMAYTFQWLTSYGQRLGMFLPWIERWPVSQTFFEKYYAGNARKLLRLTRENARPVAHAGFARTSVAGRPVTLDGTGSHDFEGSPLTYEWHQVAGPPVRLSSTASPSPTFVPAQGAYMFELVVSDGQATSAPRAVTVTVVEAGGFFQEADGLVVMEAENFWKAMDGDERAWTVGRSRPGFSGAGYVETSSRAGADRPPELRYKVKIRTPGTYVVYARGEGRDGAAEIHVGLDGETAALADHLGEFAAGSWVWVGEVRERNTETGRLDRNLAVLNITEAGPHVIHVWAGAGGVRLDKLILARHMRSETRFSPYQPGPGLGPPQSRRDNK